MTNFCTLFDSNYLTRGLALYESLQATSTDFHLYVIAFNDDCYNYLSAEQLPRITAISLKEFEDGELLKIKSTRSSAEYCWTCTPSIILYCIKNYHLPSCTYVDSDVFFYQDPEILLREPGNKSILITSHRYTPEYDQSERSGKYCVQFMYFSNNMEGLEALEWWRARCIDWCYARAEDGKFGDQKYLDDWPERFTSSHVLEHPGAGLAPWNIQQYFVSLDNGVPMITNKTSNEKFPAVFYHFHGVKFYTNHFISCCGAIYEISQNVKQALYHPYFEKLLLLEKKIKSQHIKFNPNGAKVRAPKKYQVWMDFLRDRLLLLKAGNISVFGLKLSNFNKNHYHFYRPTSLHGTVDRPENIYG